LNLFLGGACMRQNQALHVETGTGILQREARVLIKTSVQHLSLSLSPPISSSLLHPNCVWDTLNSKGSKNGCNLMPFKKMTLQNLFSSRMA